MEIKRYDPSASSHTGCSLPSFAVDAAMDAEAVKGLAASVNLAANFFVDYLEDLTQMINNLASTKKGKHLGDIPQEANNTLYEFTERLVPRLRELCDRSGFCAEQNWHLVSFINGAEAERRRSEEF